MLLSFSRQTWLTLSIVSLAVFILAQSLPLVTTSYWGFWGTQRHFLSLIIQSYIQGQYWMATFCLAIGFIVPLTLLLIQIYLLIGLNFKRRIAGFKYALSLIRWFSPWGMIPVFFLGILVALVKIAQMRTVDLELGLWAYLCLAFLLMLMQGLDVQTLKRLAQEQGSLELKRLVLLSISESGENESCSLARQGQTSVLFRSWLIPIFLTLALVFVVVANCLPMMQVSTLFSTKTYTLWQGIIGMWQTDMWFLALLIFWVSLLFPLIKILVLVTFYWQVRHQPLSGPQRIRWYCWLKYSTQWSMLDVIVILLLSVMLNLGIILSIRPLDGTLYFTLMVVFTLLASVSFKLDIPAKQFKPAKNE